MSNQYCSIRILSFFLCLIGNNVNINAQHLTPQPQFRSSVISTGFVNTHNGGFNNARSINAESFLQSNIETNKGQSQEPSILDKPTLPVISFVIPSYASGITHLLDLNGKSPKIPVPSNELLPPIGSNSPIHNDNKLNSRELPTEPKTLPNIISTTIMPPFSIAYNKNYNLPKAIPALLSSVTNTGETSNSATVQPIAYFNDLFQTTRLPTTSTVDSYTSAIPGIFFATKSVESQNTTQISQQNLSSTDSLQETTTLSPESWQRLLILGVQKTPGYAVRSDGSIDSNIAFPYTTPVPTTIVPSFKLENKPITTATPILLPVLKTAVTTSLRQNTFVNFNDNPFLPSLPKQSAVVNKQFNTQNGIFNKKSNEVSKPRVNNLFQTTHSPLFKNNVFSTSTNSDPSKYANSSNPFTAFKFTATGFQKSTKSSQTTNSGTKFSVIKTTSKPSNSVWKGNPNASTLNGFATNFASQVPVAQQPTVRNGFELSKTISVPDNNPFLPPLVPVIGIAIPNFTYNESQINLNKPENSQTQIASNANYLASSTEEAVINKFPSTSDPFAAFKFTFSGFEKNTTSSPIFQSQPTHAPAFSQTTNSESIYNVSKITTETLDTAPTASQPPTVRNGFEIIKNVIVPDNNPLLPPLASITGIAMPILAFQNQVNNPENIQATSSSSVDQMASYTEKAIINKFLSTSDPFAAFKFTVSEFKKNTTSSPIVQNEPTHAPAFSQTTNSESIYNVSEITTETLDTAPTASQPPTVRNGFEIIKNVTVPDNNPLLPPLASITGIAMPILAFQNQVNNPENIQATSSSSVDQMASSTEKIIIDPATSKPIAAFDFRYTYDSSNNQSFDNATTTTTDRISNSHEMTSNLTLIEKSTIQSPSQTLSTFFEPIVDSISVETPLNDLLPPNFPNNDLLPPLISEASIDNSVKNATANSSLKISKNPFLPTLDLNPFLAPFSSNQAQKVPQKISSIPSLDVSTTTKPNMQSNFPNKFDNSALRNNFFATPIAQVDNFKYTGGFGAPTGILSPHDKKLQ